MHLRPVLLLLAVASVLRRASASFTCSTYRPGRVYYNINYNACSADANRLDSAVLQSQGETTDFCCVSAFLCPTRSGPHPDDQPPSPEHRVSESLS